MITFLMLAIFGFSYWQTGATTPEEVKGTVTATQEGHQPYSRQFTATFANSNEVGTLNVDIKRGAITVEGHDEDDVIVELDVPNYTPESTDKDGLRELRPNNLDFHVTTDGNHIKVDSNSEQYITNLKIKVPANVNLILDSYRDGKLSISKVHGHLKARSFHSNITLEECSGSADLWTYHGNLVASLNSIDEKHALEFESYNGSIDVSLPTDIAVNTQLHTGFGKLLTDFDITEAGDPVRTAVKEDGTTRVQFDKFVRGQINGGGLVLKIETEHGDIRIRKLLP